MSSLLVNLLSELWRFNIELSLLLLLVMAVRMAVRKTTRVYNAYLLWMSIPIGLVVANIVDYLQVPAPRIESLSYLTGSSIMHAPMKLDPAVSHTSTAAVSSVGFGIALSIWAVFGIAMLARLAWQHYQLRKQLKVIAVAGEDLLYTSKYPIVAIDKNGFSPAVYGFFRPTIYFPIQLTESLQSEQIRLIIQHEEQHIRHRHLWLNLVWDIAVCVVWFNPLIYLARARFRHDQELFCDHLVLNNSTNDAGRAYGHALLTTVTATHSVSLLCAWKTFNQIEERIMNIKRPSSNTNRIALCLASALVILGTSIYTVNASQYANEQIRHQVDEQGKSEWIWQADSKKFVDKNGQRHIVEDDQQRALTSHEEKLFDAKIKQIERELKQAEIELAKHEAEIRANDEQREIIIERALDEAESGLQRYEIEVERNASESAFRQAEMDAEAAREIAELQRERDEADIEYKIIKRFDEHAEVEQQIKEIEFSQQKMRHGYQQEMQHALRSIEQAQLDIEQSYQQGDVPDKEFKRIKKQLEKAKQGLQKTIESKPKKVSKIALPARPAAPSLAIAAPLEMSPLSASVNLPTTPRPSVNLRNAH